jgi:hypothetical protein
VPLEWAGQKADVRILADRIIIQTGGGEPITHPRLSGKFTQARWLGPPRQHPRLRVGQPQAAPRFAWQDELVAGEVEVRELLAYQQLLEEVVR